MVISPDTVLIVSELVKLITPTIPIKEITELDDDCFLIETCNTFFLRKESRVTINGTVYQVKDFALNESITVCKMLSSDPDPSGDSFQVNAPKFFNGTMQSTGKELNKIMDPYEKVPMVYLHEIYEEEINRDEEARIGMTCLCKIFFLDDTNPTNFTNSDQYAQVLRPVRQMVDQFVDLLDRRKDMFGELSQTMKYIPRVNFGKYMADKGNVGHFFDGHYSGYELRVAIPVTNDYLDRLKCKNLCNC
jgi:hypothetical protein